MYLLYAQRNLKTKKLLITIILQSSLDLSFQFVLQTYFVLSARVNYSINSIRLFASITLPQQHAAQAP